MQICYCWFRKTDAFKCKENDRHHLYSGIVTRKERTGIKIFQPLKILHLLPSKRINKGEIVKQRKTVTTQINTSYAFADTEKKILT